MKLRLFAIFLILVGLGSVAFVIIGPNFGGGAASKYLSSQVSTGTVAATSVATGSVAASTVYGLRFGANPDIVSTAATTSGTGGSTGASSSATTLTWPVGSVSVKVGQTVTKGTPLASADATEAQLALTSAQATLASDQAQLVGDQGGPDTLTLAQDKNQLTASSNAYKQALSSRTNTRAQNALKLSQAQSAVSSAQAQLVADQAATPPVAATIAKDQAALSSAQGNLSSTRLAVSQSNQQADQSVTNASLSYQAAQLSYQSKIAPAPAATIAADQAQVASAQSTVNADQLSVTNATLLAPADGLIVAVNIIPGVNAPTTYAIEESAGSMVANAAFAEADIAKLAVGQSATVSISGPGVSVPGTISQIVPATTPSGGASSVVTYAVTVTLTSPPATVLAGMSATVTVTTSSVDNVLRVPTSAVSGSAAAGYSVLVLAADGSTTSAAVQIGLATTTWTQITGGLNANDTVVTGTVSARTGSATTNSSLGGLGGGAGLTGGFGR